MPDTIASNDKDIKQQNLGKTTINIGNDNDPNMSVDEEEQKRIERNFKGNFRQPGGCHQSLVNHKEEENKSPVAMRKEKKENVSYKWKEISERD